MGNPTEELRARLDELGVEWSDSSTCGKTGSPIKKTRWNNAEYVEWRNGTVRLSARDTTPEQAIAATVDAGTCKRIYHSNRITKKCTCSNCGYGASDERWAYCPKCGHKYVHGEVEEMMKAAGRKVAE